MAQAGFEGPRTEPGEARLCHPRRVIHPRRLEAQGRDQGPFRVVLEQRVQMVAAGPGTLFKLPEEAVQEAARGMAGVDPAGLQGVADGGTELLVVQAEGEEIAFRGQGVGAGRCGGGHRGRRPRALLAPQAGVVGGHFLLHHPRQQTERARGLLRQGRARRLARAVADDFRHRLRRPAPLLRARPFGVGQNARRREGHRAQRARPQPLVRRQPLPEEQ